MTSICFYFQVHQPYRLKEFTFFDINQNHYYENNELNYRIMNKVADKCYLPTNQLMLDLIKKYDGKFKITFSITGLALEQMEAWRPDVLKSFQSLAETGCVEFLSETYYHSMSFLYSKNEFLRQIELHKQAMKKYFHTEPVSFRNTELVYSNELAAFIEKLGYKAILCEGVDKILGKRTPNHLYRSPNVSKIITLPRNYHFSDDIAFRFSNKGWIEYPLTADKFAFWVHKTAGEAEVINLFMDYETFGEHQWAETGIFEFIRWLPDKILEHKDFDFRTPSEIAELFPVRDTIDVHQVISWADMERDLSAWLSNKMQQEAMQKIYSLEDQVKSTSDANLINTWARLLTSDHFYYMSTKFWADGDVHKYFSPYHSPYDAYIFYMNCLTDFELMLKKRPLLIATPDIQPAPSNSKPLKPVKKKAAHTKAASSKKAKKNPSGTTGGIN